MKANVNGLDPLRASGQVRRIPVPGSAEGEQLDVVGPVSLPIVLSAVEWEARWYVGRTVDAH